MSFGAGDAIRLVVSDVDGTLVDGKKRLTPATIAAVGRLRGAGVDFTMISARPRSGMMPIAEALAIDAPMAAFNGGTVFRRDGSILCQHRIDADVAREMLALAAGSGADVWLFADDRWHASTDAGDHVAHERIASNQPPVVSRDFADVAARADKITFVSDDPAVLDDLKSRAAHLATRATIMQSQAYYLDVTAPAANKGDGIAALAQALDVPLAAIVAIGDQANDVPMFDRAGRSIAMGQGPAAVRAKADEVTAGNDADGVAQAIDRLILAPSATARS